MHNFNTSLTSPIITGWRCGIQNLRFKISILNELKKQKMDIHSSIHVLRELENTRKKIWGNKKVKKWAVSQGNYKYMLYTPATGSVPGKRMLWNEVNRASTGVQNYAPTIAFFAITKKCSLKCEHCFEWDNLNKKEVLSAEDLITITSRLKDTGFAQVHLSGGEPMLRIDAIEKLVPHFRDSMEFYVLTSGFNCDENNIIRLKKAGVTGIVVSIDHYDPEVHDRFRGLHGSWAQATEAVKLARKHDLSATVSVCVVRDFATPEHLHQYAELAYRLGASFIQILEPVAVGHFAGKDVQLSKEHLAVLETFFDELTYSKKYAHYPVGIYHGYYQRRIGCFGSGDRSVYIDTNGDMLACPFCHIKSGNVLEGDISKIIMSMRKKGCGTFSSITA